MSLDEACLPEMQGCRGLPDLRASATESLFMMDSDSSSTTSSSGLSSSGISTDYDSESFINGLDGACVPSIFDGGRSELAPEGSTSVMDAYREPYDGESDDGSADCESIYLDTTRKPKYEDRLTRLGFVERLPDIEGMRHYRIELDIDKIIEEDKVRTGLGTITLSSSGLTILNHDGLQPKLASDLKNFNNGFLEVKESPVSGYGVFATRDLEPYMYILLERELFNANAFDLYQKLEALTEEQVKAYHTLHGHMRSSSEDIRAAIWRTNRYVEADV
ncbi:hypothetical protein NUW58_g5591 [Xylaria curta]|uniref:Uncharacterized protein n=1 Tax=Xylaria curta TaxID=42375 RepID=A0ACC1P0W7_9PEZI|nr:hypothetical protein NUW58_g5591 [Xylaria curta]